MSKPFRSLFVFGIAAFCPLARVAGQTELEFGFVRVDALAGFSPSGVTLPMAWGDFDNDGDLDLPLYRNEGDGTFVDIPGFRAQLSSTINYHGSAWGDYDNDGYLDLAILPYDNGKALLMHNLGDGMFEDVAGELGMDTVGFGETAAWGDYDADGDIDLFAPHYSHLPPGQSFLWRNNGDGTFTDVAAEAGVSLPNVPLGLRPEGAQWADYDDDGDLDLYCASHLFRNDGEGGFEDVRAQVGLPVAFDEGSMFVDIDNDGDLDLYLRTEQGGRLFRQRNGAFTDVTAESAIPSVGFYWGDTFADVDHDGDLDLLYYVPFPAPARLLLNQGDGSFLSDAEFASHNLRGGSSAWGDYDGDGDLDVIDGLNGRKLVQNQLDRMAGFEHSYLRVLVLDAAGHQTQHGATVRVKRVDEQTDLIQARVVDGGSGYLTQGQYAVHFGVVPEAMYEIAVSFPSAGGERLIVDKQADERLGYLVPLLLLDQQIVVRRDGDVAINGVVRIPSSGVARDAWRRYEAD